MSGKIIVANPFDYAKSVTHTKESLYTTEHVFNKEYITFMVNRSLSNSPQTVFFAEAMDRCQFLDKKLQYEFYLYGIPKQRGYSKWVKKEESGVPLAHIEHLASTLNISMQRAIEMHKIIGSDAVQEDIDKRGGRK